MNVLRCSCIKSKLKRTKRSLVPPIPHNIRDLDIPSEWRQTWKGQRFLQKLDCGNWGVAVYSSRFVTRSLSITLAKEGAPLIRVVLTLTLVV